ncbi:MAG TPA: SpoIID/LytB domain-containing protein [Candidatus Wallbacteria bacterium]|nr:SpoIID/LytB domain-containing protein [Candidatus Wallbacteria bacterium]
MKRYFYVLLFLFVALSLPAAGFVADAYAAIGSSEGNFKIAVVRNASKIEVSNVDYSASKEYCRLFERNKIAKNFTAAISCSGGSLAINGKKTGAASVMIYPKKNSYLKINSKPYRGKFLIKVDSASVTAINHVALEDYLKAVVPSEMEQNADLEALKAQAVVARTYALATKGKHKSAGFDLCNTTCCQVYKGVSEENPRTTKAVDSTRAQVIYHSGKLINAYYSASCGGYTESVEEAWPGAPAVRYARVIECPHCKKDAKMSWTYKIPQAEFVKKMRKAGFAINGVDSARLYDKTRSGRFNTVEMKGSFGTLYYSSEIFRKVFGNNNIRSSFFNIVIDKPKSVTKNFKFNGIDDIIKARADYNTDLLNGYVTFKGSGYGHGVGMCQHGAKKIAASGGSFRQIINYYFTKEVNIKKIY